MLKMKIGMTEMGIIIQDFQHYQEDICRISLNILGKFVLFGVIQVFMRIKQLLKYVELMEDLQILRSIQISVGHTSVV